MNVGVTATVRFVNPTDPSSQDTQAGFHYAYDFNNDGVFELGDGTYGGSVTNVSTTVAASYLGTTPGSVTIHGRIIDKDGGISDYTTTIDVVNNNSSISGSVVAKNADPRFKPSEMGIPGVTITLIDQASGGAFKMTTLTDDNGVYSFRGLSPSTYQVVVTPPAAFFEGGPNVVSGIVLHTDDNRQGLNFYEGWLKPQYISVGNFLSSKAFLGVPASAPTCGRQLRVPKNRPETSLRLP